GEAQYSDEVVRDPKVVALRDRVSATVEQGMHEDQVRIVIRLKNGATLEQFVEHAVGSLARPMSDRDLETKFRGQVQGILPKAQADRLIALCWDAGKLKDAGEVARASVPGKQSAKRAAS